MSRAVCMLLALAARGALAVLTASGDGTCFEDVTSDAAEQQSSDAEGQGRDAADASENKERDQHTTAGSLTVELLVTRHALSCANVVAKWKTSGPVPDVFPNRRVADPVLCAAGLRDSRFMADSITGPGPDRVLSSVLVRAMETAMLQYKSKSVDVVPHIREGSGSMLHKMFSEAVIDLDNRPVAVALQKEKLKEDGFPDGAMNSRWVENGKEREGSGDWPKFLEFLGKDYLPNLPKEQVGSGKIVLAVVTHSQFMAEAKHLKEQCGHLWRGHPGKKPLNNQAVRVTYKATRESGQHFTLALDKAADCVEAAPGVSYNKKPICRGDIGAVCEAELISQSVPFPETVQDAHILKLAREYAKSEAAWDTVEGVNKQGPFRGWTTNGNWLAMKQAFDQMQKQVGDLKLKNLELIDKQIKELKKTSCL